MSVFTCPACDNTRSWRNLSTGRNGTVADCGQCGAHVDRPDVTSRISVNIAWTDSTTIGDGHTETNHF